MPICVYCREEGEVDRFTTEHVVHRAFGRFQQNLTLAVGDRPSVCGECNQYFGDNIDRQITRDSYEAFQRLFQGHRDLERPEELLAIRVRVTLPPDSPHGPLILELGPPIQGRPGLYLTPQVRFQTVAGEWVCVTESELPTRNPTVDADLAPSPVAIFSSFPEPEERLKQMLRDFGIDLAEWHEIPDLPEGGVREMDLEIQGSVDPSVARAMAKIAFNYLVWVEGAEFVLRAEFDPIRQFIRYGAGEWSDFVELSWRPILAHDTEGLRHTSGHLITLGFTGGPEGTLAGRLLGQVSLYNTMTYHILLCPRLMGLWRDIASGHHFDLGTRTVYRLGRTTLSLPPILRPVLWD